MAKKIGILLSIFVFTIILNLALVSKIHAQTKKETQITYILDELHNLQSAGFDNMDVDFYIDKNEKDERVAILKTFFRKYDSPLYDHAAFIVSTSDANSLDFRLIPAIAMQESTACKFIPHNSHNCWGWGIYGNTVTRFSSYPEAIDTIARGLKKNYIDKGLTTPEQIMKKYTPSSNGSWARGVNTVLGVME